MFTQKTDGQPAEWFDIERTDDTVRRRRRWPLIGLVVLVVVALVVVIAMGHDEPATVEAATTATTILVATQATPGPTPAHTTTATPTTTAPVIVRAPQRVAFFGDSLAVETDPHLARLMRERGIEYRFEGYGGTATCDYLDEMQRSASEFRPDVVVLLFTGNALTPCMTSRAGGERGILTREAELDLLGYAAAYHIDTAAAIDRFGDDVRVMLVGPPETRPGRSAAALIIDDLYRDHAATRANVDLLDDIELLTPNGEYADELPCTFLEPSRQASSFVSARTTAGTCAPMTGSATAGCAWHSRSRTPSSRAQRPPDPPP